MKWKHALVHSEIVFITEGQNKLESTALWVARIPRCPTNPEGEII